jgi:hypothetical protein
MTLALLATGASSAFSSSFDDRQTGAKAQRRHTGLKIFGQRYTRTGMSRMLRVR